MSTELGDVVLKIRLDSAKAQAEAEMLKKKYEEIKRVKDAEMGKAKSKTTQGAAPTSAGVAPAPSTSQAGTLGIINQAAQANKLPGLAGAIRALGGGVGLALPGAGLMGTIRRLRGPLGGIGLAAAAINESGAIYGYAQAMAEGRPVGDVTGGFMRGLGQGAEYLEDAKRGIQSVTRNIGAGASALGQTISYLTDQRLIGAPITVQKTQAMAQAFFAVAEANKFMEQRKAQIRSEAMGSGITQYIQDGGSILGEWIAKYFSGGRSR